MLTLFELDTVLRLQPQCVCTEEAMRYSSSKLSRRIREEELLDDACEMALEKW